MSTQSRKEREKQEMKARILEAAHQLFKEKGYDGLQIRAIAEAIDYSPATIYLYFKDKNEIYFGLQQEAAKIKSNHFQPVMLIEDPWERLKAFGQHYIDFGLQYPDWYNLIFITRAPMEHAENLETWRLGINVHQIFVDTVEACVQHRHFKSTDTEAISFTLWCYAHGVVSLFIRERMRMYPAEKRPELLKRSYAMLVKMAETL